MRGKKSKMIALHVDEQLHSAVKQGADVGGRQIVDHVRYILEIWHGLREPERIPAHLTNLLNPTFPAPQKKTARSMGKAG